MIHMRQFNSFEEKNLKFLTQKSIEFTLVQITATGFKKSILDATEPMRQYFIEVGMHDYEQQPQGQLFKVNVPSYILDDTSLFETSTSLYRPETKKGDPRIWPGRLTRYCEADDILMMLYYQGSLYIVNITRINIEKVFNCSVDTPLKDLIRRFHNEVMSVSHELTERLRDIATEWRPTELLADTSIGRAIEKLLDINMNSSKDPDYKGIELKSSREKRPGIRSTLFTQVPDWAKSKLMSAKEIVQKYGYERDGTRTYQNTLRCTIPNSQNLGLTLYQFQNILTIEEKRISYDKHGDVFYPKVDDVALWQLSKLHERLKEKHRETFWIEVETKHERGVELFRPKLIEHTKNPVVSQFDSLLDTGYITVDLLLSRPSGNGDTIAFKINKKSRPMLFPDSEIIRLQ